MKFALLTLSAVTAAFPGCAGARSMAAAAG
jgi:hypothetical protein